MFFFLPHNVGLFEQKKIKFPPFKHIFLSDFFYHAYLGGLWRYFTTTTIVYLLTESQFYFFVHKTHKQTRKTILHYRENSKNPLLPKQAPK